MSLSIGQATGIVFKTLPYLLLRAVVYSLFGLLSLLYLGILLVTGQAMAGLHEYAQAGVWFMGLLLSFPITYFAREYLLYLVKAGHVAVIAELATKGALPPGVSQIQWGRDQVQARFKNASILFAIDRLAHGVIRAVNRVMWQIGNFFQFVPGAQGIVKIANTVLFFSLTYVDESVLARNFLNPRENVWESSKNGLVLYAQSWRQILSAAVILGLASMIAFPALFLLLLMPALAAGQAWPELKIPAIIAAGVFAWVLKAVFLDPWTLANMIVTYLKTTQGMAVNPEWERKLEGISSKFKKIQDRAAMPAPTA